MTSMSTRPTSGPARRPLSVVFSLLIALSLLLAGPTVSAGAADGADISPRELVPLLTRSGIGPDFTLIDVIYAPQLFFDATGIPMPSEFDADRALAFILQESVHDGDLPIAAAEAFLLLPGGERVLPFEARVTADDVHHRVSRLLFDRPDDWPAAIENDSGEPVLRLIVPQRDGSFSVGNTFEWRVPVVVEASTTPEG